MMTMLDLFTKNGLKPNTATHVMCDKCKDIRYYKEGEIRKDEETQELIFVCDECLEIEGNPILNYMNMKGEL